MRFAKVFGIGLSKTGTVSLHEALQTLGLRSLHWGGPEIRQRIEKAMASGRPMLADIEDVDAYSDIEVLSRNVELLDHQYPGSGFVLTTRPRRDWVESRRRHVERNRDRRAAGEYHGTFLTVDVPAWEALYDEHHDEVRCYFAGRDDLLIIDITAGEGYEVLCPFLDVDIPATPFPWRHRARRSAPG